MIFTRLSRYLMDGTVISRPVYQKMVEEAHRYVAEDLAAKLAWRAAHPKFGWKIFKDGTTDWVEKHRRKIVGRNVRHVVTEMIHMYPEMKKEIRCV